MKRILALVLTIALLASSMLVLGSCGNDDPGNVAKTDFEKIQEKGYFTCGVTIFENMNEKEADLKTVDTENVDEMIYVMPMTNVLREDERKQPFTRESLLEGAPQRSEDSWQVPRLVK